MSGRICPVTGEYALYLFVLQPKASKCAGRRGWPSFEPRGIRNGMGPFHNEEDLSD